LISSIAMHHVVYERKRELYAEIDGLPKDPLHLDQTAACPGILFTLREELLVTSQPSLTREGSFDCAYRFALANRHASLRTTKSTASHSTFCHALRHPLSGFARS